jgi:hypothetical protein
VQDLFVRTVREQGQSSLGSIRERLKLPHTVLEPVFRQLRQQAYLDVKGMQGNDYYFGLTAAGKALAAERASICSYAGPAPVSLAAYERAVRQQAAHVQVSRDSLRQALGDLVLPDTLLDQLGPALISQKALFLYGPTGNGKTSLAERLLRVYEDAVLIPYALEISSYIITLFDPVLHRRWPSSRTIWTRAGCSAIARRWRPAESWSPKCWNCGPTRPPASTPRRCR